MFRGPQILALTCPVRSPRTLLLGLRDPGVPGSPDPPPPWWAGPRARGSSPCQGGRARREGGGGEETVSLRSAISSSQSTSPQNSTTPEAAPPASSHQPRDSGLNPGAHRAGWFGSGLAFDPWGTTMSRHSEQNCDAVREPDSSTALDGSSSIECLQPRGRTDSSRPPPALRPLSFSVKPKPHPAAQSRPFHTHPTTRTLLGSSIPQPWTLDFLSAGQPPHRALSLPPTRALHQAVLRREAALRDCLSRENQERCRQTLGPNLGLYAGDRAGKGASGGPARWASVLVSLCSVEGQPAFLFTLRSSTLKGRHKGDVSFAGGKRDPTDQDVVDTALREAREELGVTVATDNVWGVLKPLRDMSGMMIAPVLANLGPLEELSFKPNPGEVEEIFTLSLSHVCSPENTGYTHFRTGDRYGYTLPVFRNGKHRVWGLTAVALQHTLRVILPS